MLRRLFGFVERTAERAATLLVDGMEAAALRDEVERLTMRFAAKEQWANLKVELLTAEVTNQEKLLAMPVMAAWRPAGGRWERQQTCAEPVADFAVACADGSWWVRVEPESQWSSRPDVDGVWICGGLAPNVDGAKAAVDSVLSYTYRLIGGSHGGPRWISAWRETATRSIRHLHGYGRVASVSPAGWEVIVGNLICASGPETGDTGKHLADVVLLNEYGKFEPLEDGVHWAVADSNDGPADGPSDG